MINPEAVLYWLVVWHFIADYGLQTDYIARNKSSDVLVLFAHSHIHGAGVLLAGGSSGAAWMLVTLHYVIDAFNLKSKAWDQVAHYVSILFVGHYFM